MFLENSRANCLLSQDEDTKQEIEEDERRGEGKSNMLRSTKRTRFQSSQKSYRPLIDSKAVKLVTATESELKTSTNATMRLSSC